MTYRMNYKGTWSEFFPPDHVLRDTDQFRRAVGLRWDVAAFGYRHCGLHIQFEIKAGWHIALKTGAGRVLITKAIPDGPDTNVLQHVLVFADWLAENHEKLLASTDLPPWQKKWTQVVVDPP